MPPKGVTSDQAAEHSTDGNNGLTTAVWPIDPLQHVTGSSDAEFRRRTIQGILESYHSSYDVLAEGLQNAVDAVEDASLAGLAGPYSVQVTINLTENWLAIMDSGLGMSLDQVTSAFAPNVSFKDPATSKRDKKHMYRGYKGVGLTFLAYGTDDITIHSKTPAGEYTKALMRYGRSWAERRRADAAVMVEDTGAHPHWISSHAAHILKCSSRRPPDSRASLNLLPHALYGKRSCEPRPLSVRCCWDVTVFAKLNQRSRSSRADGRQTRT